MTYGRPTKRSPEREKLILDALQAGNTRQAACKYAGIALHTLARWAESNATFASAIEKAEGDAEVRAVATIVRAANTGQWTAAAWWLERRRPDDYARRDRVDIEVYVRQRARELGLDEDEALEAIRPRLKLVS